MRTVLLSLLSIAAAAAPERTVQSLAGAWRFALDPGNQGLNAWWFAGDLAGTVQLPGSTDTNHQGPDDDRPGTMRLRRRWNYAGQAWDQRDIDISGAWGAKHVTLLLERTKATRVWIDGREAGGQQVRLMTPHIYDLTGLATPGRHRLTVLVDSGYAFPVSGHALSPDTQTNWNGIIGRIELTATDPVRIERITATPDVARKSARLSIEIHNSTGKPVLDEHLQPWRTPNRSKRGCAYRAAWRLHQFVPATRDVLWRFRWRPDSVRREPL